jgi:single-strand DNA-binding protein
VYIEGRIQSREWEAQDGTKKNRTEIVAENMIMLDRSGNTAGGAAPRGEAMASATAQSSTSAGAAESEEVRVEDIPF